MRKVKMFGNDDFINDIIKCYMNKINNTSSISSNSVNINHFHEFRKRIDFLLLGIDFSPSKVGLSLSDNCLQIANPLFTITRPFNGYSIDKNELKIKRKIADEFVVKEIDKIIQNFNVKGIVVGYPLEMDGTEGPACDRVRRFINRLSMEISTAPLLFESFDNNNPQLLNNKTYINLTLWDERLSTQVVRYKPAEITINKKFNKTKSKIHYKFEKNQIDEDAIASSFILQGLLDNMNTKLSLNSSANYTEINAKR